MAVQISFQISDDLALRLRDGTISSLAQLTDAQAANLLDKIREDAVAALGPAAVQVGSVLVGFWRAGVAHTFSPNLVVRRSEPGYVVLAGRPGFSVMFVEGTGTDTEAVVFCDALMVDGLEAFETPFLQFSELPDVSPFIYT